MASTEDIRNHIERETQDNIDRGMAPEEARRQAMLTFGNVALAKEDTRARLGLGMARRGAPGSPVRGPHPPQKPGFCDGRGSHTGAGDWRQHHDVQRPECRSAPAAPVSGPGAVGDVMDGGSDSEPSRGQISAWERRTVAESKSELRGHGRLRCRVQDADGSRRGGTDRRRQHLAQPASTPRRSARTGTRLFDGRSRAAATAGPDQSSLLASAFRRLERCDWRDHRAQRPSFPDHRRPPCWFPDRDARCRRVGAADDV